MSTWAWGYTKPWLVGSLVEGYKILGISYRSERIVAPFESSGGQAYEINKDGWIEWDSQFPGDGFGVFLNEKDAIKTLKEMRSDLFEYAQYWSLTRFMKLLRLEKVLASGVLTRGALSFEGDRPIIWVRRFRIL